VSCALQDLNLYCQKLPFPLLGFSQFPWSYAKEPKQVRPRILRQQSIASSHCHMMLHWAMPHRHQRSVIWGIT
jgi:hypothetical protein